MKLALLNAAGDELESRGLSNHGDDRIIQSAECAIEHNGTMYTYDDTSADTVFYKEASVLAFRPKATRLEGEDAANSLYGREIG